MRILFFSLGKEQVASSRTRVFQYLPYFKDRGIKYCVQIYNPFVYSKYNGRIVNKVRTGFIYCKLVVFIVTSFFYKIVFIQKIYLPQWIVWLLSVLNKKIVYDFDDAIYMYDDNSQLSTKYLRRFNYILSKASLVIIENEETESYTKQFCKNVLRITGPIECNRYRPSEIAKGKGIINIGWIGSSSTTKYLLLIKDAFMRLKDKFGDNICFITIGADEKQLDGFPIVNYPWSLDTEVELLQKFDIGIMPLPDDKWSKGKGGYKILQYMAMGIPSVASPVGINSKLLSNHCGLLATITENWLDQMEILVNNVDIRNKIGSNARSSAVVNYSFEVNTKLLIDAINNL